MIEREARKFLRDSVQIGPEGMASDHEETAGQLFASLPSPQEAERWTRLLRLSGYEAECSGREVRLGTAYLQEPAMSLAVSLGFSAPDQAGRHNSRGAR